MNLSKALEQMGQRSLKLFIVLRQSTDQPSNDFDLPGILPGTTAGSTSCLLHLSHTIKVLFMALSHYLIGSSNHGALLK